MACCQLNQQINQAAYQHRRYAQIKKNQHKTCQRQSGLVDVVSEYRLNFFPGVKTIYHVLKETSQ